ncbi:hypothetical protein Tco_0788705 [Tanacetum coccineum]
MKRKYDQILLTESAGLFASEERFLKIKQVMDEKEQNQTEVMQELLLKLMKMICKILKEFNKRRRRRQSQSFIPYLNFSMIDDEGARDNFLKDVYTFLRKFSHISFGVTPKVILITWESFGKIKDALMDKQYIDQRGYSRINDYVIWRRPKANHTDEHSERGPKTLPNLGERNLSKITEKDNLVQDILITSPKIDFLSEEFAGEFAPIPPRMDEDEFDEEEVDCLIDHDISSDDNSYENIEYVEASPLNLEYDSLEEENEDQKEKEFDLEDIFQIQDVILHEKLLNVHHLITNIESLKNNPTPDFVFKSPSSFPIPVMDSGSFFEESDTFLSHSDNSLPEFETFSDHTEESE